MSATLSLNGCFTTPLDMTRSTAAVYTVFCCSDREATPSNLNLQPSDKKVLKSLEKTVTQLVFNFFFLILYIYNNIA